MLMTISEAKKMMEYDKKEINKKIKIVAGYLKSNPSDRGAIKKFNNLLDILKTTEEYIEHYSKIEQIIPEERRNVTA
jgi:hypothetical protein